MKISNKAKDYIVLVVIFLIIIWFLTSFVVFVRKAFAEQYLTEAEQYNKYCAEQTVKNEMQYFAMKEYMDNISVEEYVNTFFAKGE